MVPSDLQLKLMNIVHKGAIKLTGGRLGWTAGGMPSLELTTTGRKSGDPRTVMLTSPLQLGGNDQHPAWYLNLVANPKVTVRYQGGSRQAMVARTVTDAERADLWPQITQRYRGYAGYQDKTDRTIPVVVLEPVR
jgi:deazaflavin-dependent oxidoreductase (nitroreductase family)